MSSRFDYVEYDELANQTQASFKEKCSILECLIDSLVKSPRAKALAITHLETVYMWIGKGIRDDQITRNGSAPLQEQRTNDGAK